MIARVHFEYQSKSLWKWKVETFCILFYSPSIRWLIRYDISFFLLSSGIVIAVALAFAIAASVSAQIYVRCPELDEIQVKGYQADCSKYYGCVDGKVTLKECFDDLLFDKYSYKCEIPRLSSCKNVIRKNHKLHRSNVSTQLFHSLILYRKRPSRIILAVT